MMTRRSEKAGESMGTKERLLELFEERKGSFLSGEDIAQALSVSRTAVWKAVNALRQEGYPIEAATNRGYCLPEKTDVLSEQGIRRSLKPEWHQLDITVLPTVGSTNALIREMAGRGGPEGCVAVAGEQTAGRGRSGRQFYSPKDTGIYLSLLLRPRHCAVQRAAGFTSMAAVAMCEAIEAVSGENAQIKWVNDVFVRGKKVCGILTEASLGMENGEVEYVVLGAGVNVYPPRGGFPGDLAPIAGAVLEEIQNDAKNRLAGEFISRVMDMYTAPEMGGYVEKYRERSLVLGKTVTLLPQGRSAFVYGIDDACRLLVRDDNGETACLSYGEIQVRL